MLTRSFRRTTILLFLVAAFATPWVCAAGPRAAESARPAQALEPAHFDLFNQLWNTLWSLWSETGCGIDPRGRCQPGSVPKPPAATQSDTGCGIDPDGRCHS
jgi:hypothetical protein